MPFRNRIDAGRRLAEALQGFKVERPVILALPRGGVPVAAEVARALEGPLDLVLVRKIGVPSQPELAMGAVVDGPIPFVVRNDDVIRMARISDEEFAEVRDRELAEIRRRRACYVGIRPPIEQAARLVIVIDDGIATGATMRAALRAVRNQSPKGIVLAVPVAPTSTLQKLRSEADRIVCLEEHEDFGAIGYYYDEFGQLSDDEVTRLLSTSRTGAATAKDAS